MAPKEMKILLGIAITLVLATVGAITYFAPMSLATENSQKIAMMGKSDLLEEYVTQRWNLINQCMNKKTEEWECSDGFLMEFQKVNLKIEVLREELGLEPERDTHGLPPVPEGEESP